MEQLKINHQIAYYHPKNALGIAMNLMSFGYFQFNKITLVTKFKELESLSELIGKGQIPNPGDVAIFGGEQLINSIRLTICFENFMKGLLLINGYLIHKLDKNKFPLLNEKQYSEPIKIQEVLSNNQWEINPKIRYEDKDWTKQIKGILKFTLGMKDLMSPKYQEVFKINDIVVEICQPYFNYRNNLHLYTGEEISIGEETAENINKLIQFVNNHLVRINNKIVDELSKGDEYKLKKIEHRT